VITTFVGPIGTVAKLVTLFCVGPLVYLTLRRRPGGTPSAVTWGIWAAVGLIATVAMWHGGAPTDAWHEKLALSLGPVAVCAAALYRRVPWKMSRHDTWSLWLGLAGILVYIGTGAGEAMIAVGTAMVVDGIGGWPTLVKAWREPYGELITTYALALASVIAVLAILPLPWTWLSASYLLFLAVQMTVIIGTFVVARRDERRDERRRGPLEVTTST
jgi:hypothetical protein